MWFKSKDGDEFIWTPTWRAVIDLSASAKFLEETNKPKSEWNEPLTRAYDELEQKAKLSGMLTNAATSIAATLGHLQGERRIDKLFPMLPPELKHKSEQILYALSNAKDIDDFLIRLNPLIPIHKKYFNEPQFRSNFNLIIKNLELKIDDNLNLVKG